ncbi:BlaI/MecI/CopY family transcriptional regulator [Bacillus safensis]|uniref:BlaI/MecI/CopY family transcriptional regulator n=1 Tax=Bacillus TaxID=1386 RepID=UPI002280EAB1|nr:MULTISPECIES: BlaI/MecI/CopY family transcriptional regulator [Bacillus]MEC3709131.1 BlaI/MecI/CopY family transcriptional regulator [Bacillus safensis]MEC3755142.1 BlaI/MecI/CopY family transcriptional regulator [Bacillus safensis]MED0909614.1 BlaI/MecI/CopY family transcriptional regulator [Bacillus safensis]WNF52696.1 BlaI/MecI/CopY family transcriptional regulator [Bacillus sp. SG20001]
MFGGDCTSDLERKIYRIIYNMSRFRKNPTIDDLKRKTGKDETTVRQAVKNLLEKEELKWDKEKREWRF